MCGTFTYARPRHLCYAYPCDEKGPFRRMKRCTRMPNILFRSDSKERLARKSWILQTTRLGLVEGTVYPHIVHLSPLLPHYLLHAYRSCAGQNFADAIIYIGIVSILATFDISKPRDENGVEVEPEITFAAALIRYVPFCSCGLFCYRGNLTLALIFIGRSILSSARLSLGRTQLSP